MSELTAGPNFFRQSKEDAQLAGRAVEDAKPNDCRRQGHSLDDEHGDGLVEVTNEQFLQAIFGGDYQLAHVTAFSESPDKLDPANRKQSARCWAGGWYSQKWRGLKPELNTYFTISLFEPSINAAGAKEARRRKSLHRRTACIVVDDVGTKVPWASIKLPASWHLETSPGNFQVGYILASGGEIDRVRVEGLVNAMVAKGLAVNGNDPGMKGVTRYVRLPQGSNLKSTYIEKFGPCGWRCRMKEWQPKLAYALDELADAFCITADDIERHADRDEFRQARLDAAPGGDPVLDAFAAIGSYKHPLSDGWHDVTCCLVHEHTDSADNGAAVRVNADGSYGYRCHHKHGGELKFPKVVEWFDSEHPELGLRAKLAARSVASPDEFEVVPGEDPERRGGTAQIADDAMVKAMATRFTPIPLSHFLTRPMPRWHVKNLIPQAELVMVYGQSGDGKSFWILDVVAAVARGEDWCGRRVLRGRVAYVVAEGAGGFVNRVNAYLMHHGLDHGELDLEIVPAAPNLTGPDVKALIAGLQSRGRFDIVVLDTLAAVSSGANENGSEMGPVLDACKKVHAAVGATVIVVHHAGKDVERGARGWSGIRAAMDAEIEISRQEDVRKARITKMKDGSDADKPMPFRLERVRLGEDEDGDPITSCVVVHDGVFVSVMKPAGQRQRQVLDKFKLLAEFGEVKVDDLVEACFVQWDVTAGKKDRRREKARAVVKDMIGLGFFRMAGEVLTMPGDDVAQGDPLALEAADSEKIYEVRRKAVFDVMSRNLQVSGAAFIDVPDIEQIAKRLGTTVHQLAKDCGLHILERQGHYVTKGDMNTAGGEHDQSDLA